MGQPLPGLNCTPEAVARAHVRVPDAGIVTDPLEHRSHVHVHILGEPSHLLARTVVGLGSLTNFADLMRDIDVTKPRRPPMSICSRSRSPSSCFISATPNARAGHRAPRGAEVGTPIPLESKYASRPTGKDYESMTKAFGRGIMASRRTLDAERSILTVPAGVLLALLG